MRSDEINIFNDEGGASYLQKPVPFFLLLLTIAIIGSLVGSGGMITGIAFMAIPFVLTYVYFIFKYPKFAIIGLLLCNYVILGFNRYIKGLPLGMTVDFHLVIMYVALFFKSFFEKVHWKDAKGDLLVLTVVWFGWILFQLVNPQAVARVLWFNSMRSVGLYMILTIPLILILFNKRKDIHLFFTIWAVLAILGAIKGIVQKFVGLDPFEFKWLMGSAMETHLLFGKIRYFSFFSNAGQFGASMGHSGVIFGILAFNQKESKKLKYFYAIASIFSLYGMMISGTRGAIAVPIMGFGLYTVLQKNVKVLILGAIMGIAVLVFFKYTTIGQSNYTISRMRSAFNPEDASFQVRLENQRKLKSYMASRPFGAGIGSTGKEAKKLAPGSAAAQIPTDSWYVLIWVEQGIIGLMIHLFILLYIVFKSSYVIMFKLKDPWVKAQLGALVSGLWGVMVASYGNAVLGQMPTVIIIYVSMAFLFLGHRYEKEIEDEHQKGLTPQIEMT